MALILRGLSVAFSLLLVFTALVLPASAQDETIAKAETAPGALVAYGNQNGQGYEAWANPATGGAELKTHSNGNGISTAFAPGAEGDYRYELTLGYTEVYGSSPLLRVGVGDENGYLFWSVAPARNRAGWWTVRPKEANSISRGDGFDVSLGSNPKAEVKVALEVRGNTVFAYINDQAAGSRDLGSFNRGSVMVGMDTSTENADRKAVVMVKGATISQILE